MQSHSTRALAGSESGGLRAELHLIERWGAPRFAAKGTPASQERHRPSKCCCLRRSSLLDVMSLLVFRGLSYLSLIGYVGVWKLSIEI